MKFRPFALLASLVSVVILGACSEDPTETGSGVPEAIVTTRSEIFQTQGAKFSVTAYTVDENLKRIPGKLDVAPAGPAVGLDSVVYVSPLAETRIFMSATAKSAAPGTAVTVSGHGLSTDVTVIIS